ncbi:30S ribosomal protein S12 methylthiotransferase RimO [Pontiella sp.]|uniref:30S ribosomal protein S12 methylthiotransferase RimO n=1 Tax=Pontiella sp. TaxID=2837462 RepID=UPI00356780B5
MKKNIQIYIVSLGCAKNWLDTEIMAGSAVSSGMLITPYLEEADIFLINTCSFIFDARTEAEQNIREALLWKKKKKRRKVVVAGCLPQRNIDEVQGQYPDVDLFLGLNDVASFPRLVETMYAGDAAAPQMGECTYIYDENTPRLQLTPSTYAYLKIAEGCNHKCAFCAIPLIRGLQRSRPVDSIVREAKNLIGNGVYELILIAQDTTSYGTDLDEDASLPMLIAALDRIEADFCIRILYTHPLHFSDDVIAMFATSKHLVPYVDIPLQHASTSVLKAMKRGATEQTTRNLVERIKQGIPAVTLRSTFIVGFPGETEADYQALKQFILDAEFDRLGVFTYSPEEGTSAAGLNDGLVPADVAEARRDELMQLQSEIALKKNQAKIGRVLEVIIEGEDDEGIVGRTFGDAPEVDNLVHVEIPEGVTELPPMIQVRITDAETYDLFGQLA